MKNCLFLGGFQANDLLQELASALTTAGQHELTLSLLEAFQSGEKTEFEMWERGVESVSQNLSKATFNH